MPFWRVNMDRFSILSIFGICSCVRCPERAWLGLSKINIWFDLNWQREWRKPDRYPSSIEIIDDSESRVKRNIKKNLRKRNGSKLRPNRANKNRLAVMSWSQCSRAPRSALGCGEEEEEGDAELKERATKMEKENEMYIRYPAMRVKSDKNNHSE